MAGYSSLSTNYQTSLSDKHHSEDVRLNHYCPRIKMNKRQASTSSAQESASDNRPRKRVCKACDRCRSKKAKVSMMESPVCAISQRADLHSAMEKHPAAVVHWTRPTVTMERGNRAVKKCIPAGECVSYCRVFSCVVCGLCG